MKRLVQSLSESLLSELRSNASRLRPSRPKQPVSLPSNTAPRGRVLLCYLSETVGLREDDNRLKGHPNRWDSWLIANTLTRLGWDVDVIDWDDHGFQPERHYDAVIALDWNGKRIVDATPEARPRLVLHLTTAYPSYHNVSEEQRLRALEDRRGVALKPHRHLAHDALSGLAIAEAHACSLIGNAWTLGTYPSEVQPKLSLLPVTAPTDKNQSDALFVGKPVRNNTFLWFAGGGAVHKGLDLALEAVSTMSNIHLHVVGNLEAERDFLWHYRTELFRQPNISFHGYLPAHSARLTEVMREATFLITPTCSEGTSTAAVLCLIRGLIPIYSESVGISVPGGLGWMVTVPTPEAFRSSLTQAMTTPPDVRAAMSLSLQDFASHEFSRTTYAEMMEAFLSHALT